MPLVPHVDFCSISPGYAYRINELLSKNLPLIMVFRRKCLHGGRQKNQFYVKILILVCPKARIK